jgi:hypothetical protein
MHTPRRLQTEQQRCDRELLTSKLTGYLHPTSTSTSVSTLLARLRATYTYVGTYSTYLGILDLEYSAQTDSQPTTYLPYL